MRTKRELLTPDLTPLIDVVFILLIFFIVSSVFKKEELALLLTLPSSQAQEVEVEIKQINIELSREELALKGKKLSFNELEQSLKNITQKDKPIIVRIDQDVTYKRVIIILNLLQKYSLNNLALVTNEKKISH